MGWEMTKKQISELKEILIELRYIARQYSKLQKRLIALLKNKKQGGRV
jgi:hypothetical protein